MSVASFRHAAIRKGEAIPGHLIADGPLPGWHPPALAQAHAALDATAKSQWLWWRVAQPASRREILADLVEDSPAGVVWNSARETEYLLGLMSPLNLAKVQAARNQKQKIAGCVCRRTRPDSMGVRRQRAEVRFDDIAGCLRTPSGGSSRQTLLIVEGNSLRSRLLSPREAARLMGLADSYVLPARYNDACHLAGDGVCVPGVRHIAQHLLEPVLAANAVVPALIAA